MTSGPVSVSDALSALGGDLTMSISFSIARELLAAADEAQIQQAELIGLVLSSTVVLSAVPTATAAAWDRCTKLRVDGVGDKSTVVDDNAGLGAFVSVFINVAQRISASICVQLVAANYGRQWTRKEKIINRRFYPVLENFGPTGGGVILSMQRMQTCNNVDQTPLVDVEHHWQNTLRGVNFGRDDGELAAFRNKFELQLKTFADRPCDTTFADLVATHNQVCECLTYCGKCAGLPLWRIMRDALTDLLSSTNVDFVWDDGDVDLAEAGQSPMFQHGFFRAAWKIEVVCDVDCDDPNLIELCEAFVSYDPALECSVRCVQFAEDRVRTFPSDLLEGIHTLQVSTDPRKKQVQLSQEGMVAWLVEERTLAPDSIADLLYSALFLVTIVSRSLKWIEHEQCILGQKLDAAFESSDSVFDVSALDAAYDKLDSLRDDVDGVESAHHSLKSTIVDGDVDELVDLLGSGVEFFV